MGEILRRFQENQTWMEPFEAESAWGQVLEQNYSWDGCCKGFGAASTRMLPISISGLSFE